ncbi:MAG: helix-turn-helix domain-containing protein [Sporichthyaceae bacterium]
MTRIEAVVDAGRDGIVHARNLLTVPAAAAALRTGLKTGWSTADLLRVVRQMRSDLGLKLPRNHSIRCYIHRMAGRGDLLREVMLKTSITQSELSRISGVRQPSISQFLSGKVELSDELLDRLLCCMGYQLEVVRRPVEPNLTRSERRSWVLHRRLSSHLDRSTLEEWRPTIERNLERLRNRVVGQPHLRNLDLWTSLVQRNDVLGLHRVMTGLDRDSIGIREVSPMGGLLSSTERTEVLGKPG